jgi:hypothetical protein
MKPDRNIFLARLLCSFAGPALLLCGLRAEAAGWEDAYRKGDYTNALQALEKTTQEFPDIGNYNKGNVLYRQKDFQGSEKAYADAAAQTRDDSLRQKALYNRGTALLAGTTTQTDPSKIDAKIAAATQAAGLFEDALTLNPRDLDAKQNLERALKLKEQLEQQKQDQQQQDQQDQQKDQKQDQDKQDQQEQQKNDPQKQDEQNQQQDQPQDKQDPQKQDEQQNGQDQQDQKQNGQQKQDEQKDQQPSARPKQAGEMSPEEANQLLDAMKQDEQDRRANLKPFLGGPVRVDKDW